MADCLTDIVGITRSNCSCYTDPLLPGGDPDWYKQSVSGRFLDELPGMIAINAIEGAGDCSGVISDFYKNGLIQAGIDIQTDFLRGLTTRYRQRHKPYIGKSGSVESNGTELATGRTYSGIMIRNKDMRGGMLKLKTIYCMFATPPTELYLYRAPFEGENEYVLELVTSFVGLAIAPNTKYALPVAIAPATLDLDMDGYRYFLIYEAAGVVARNNKTSCGCGRRENEMSNFVQLNGIAGDDLNDFSSWKNTGFSRTAPAYGLALELTANCDARTLFCALFNSEDVYKEAIPETLLYRAGYLVYQYILKSAELNEWTMNSRESMYGMRNQYEKKYTQLIAWMVENVALDRFTDCFECSRYNKQVGKINLLTSGR